MFQEFGYARVVSKGGDMCLYSFELIWFVV